MLFVFLQNARKPDMVLVSIYVEKNYVEFVVQCGAVITRSIFNQIPTNTPHSSPVSFFVLFQSLSYANSYYVGPRYNDTRLYSIIRDIICVDRHTFNGFAVVELCIFVIMVKYIDLREVGQTHDIQTQIKISCEFVFNINWARR